MLDSFYIWKFVVCLYCKEGHIWLQPDCGDPEVIDNSKQWKIMRSSERFNGNQFGRAVNAFNWIKIKEICMDMNSIS